MVQAGRLCCGLLVLRPDGPLLLPDVQGNISWPFMAGIVVLLLVYYFGWARARFQGPKIMGAEADLTELEREFEHAAEELGGAAPPDIRPIPPSRPGPAVPAGPQPSTEQTDHLTGGTMSAFAPGPSPQGNFFHKLEKKNWSDGPRRPDRHAPSWPLRDMQGR